MSIKVGKRSVVRIGIGAVAALALVGATVAGTTAVISAQTTGTSVPGSATDPTSSSPAPEANFANAKKFTRAALSDDFDTASSLTSADSAAARYIEHQQNVAKAQKLEGTYTKDDDFTMDPNNSAESIEIEQGDLSYAWKSFTYDSQGLVTGWTGKRRPVGESLWNKSDADSASGVKAEVLSAYRANGGAVWVVLEVQSSNKVNLPLWEAKYVAEDDYSQKPSSATNISELKKGEKTLVYLTFDDAKFGGKLSIEVSSPDWEKTETLNFKIK